MRVRVRVRVCVCVVEQYNIIRTELRKVSSQLTATVNIAKHHFLEVADSIDEMRENVEAIHEGR